MTKKYFFFDVDETLIPHTGGNMEIPDATEKALQELQKRGHFCAIATGRPQYFAKDLCAQLGFQNYVSDGGNGITIEGKLVRLLPMDHDACVALADQCNTLGYLWAASTENVPVRYSRFPNIDKELEKRGMMQDVYQPDLDLRKCPNIYKMFIDCKEGEEQQLSALSRLIWERYTPNFILVEPGNKEVGIRSIMDVLKAPYKDVVVFGDGVNDLSMFQPEWTSIAMGNAIPELKEKADFVTRDADDDGIVYALRHFGWID